MSRDIFTIFFLPLSLIASQQLETLVDKLPGVMLDDGEADRWTYV